MERIGFYSLATLACATLARAQHIDILLCEGDVIPGVGTVDGGVSHPVKRIAIDDAGNWVVHADTNNADTNLDEFVMRNGSLVWVEEGPVPAPVGATANTFNAFSQSTSGSVAHCLGLNNTPGGTADNWGLYKDGTLVALKGQTPPGTWGAGTVWTAFEDVAVVSDTLYVVRGRVTDPISVPVNDWFASIWTLDGSGLLLSENVIVRAGEILPGQTLTVNTVRSSPDACGTNSFGHVLYGCDLDTTSPPSDSVVYLWNGTTNVLIAQEGFPSGVGAFNWGDLLAPELSLNDAGDWVIKDLVTGATSATDGVIVKNGAKFRQEGDTLPSIGGSFVFTTFSNAPAQLTASGEVLWFGDWSDPDTTKDTGIFLNDDLLVQEGVSRADGMIVRTISGQNGAQYISPNGRYVLFFGQLANMKDALFLLDREQTYASFCAGDGLDDIVSTACPCANLGTAGHGCGNSFSTGGALLTGTGTTSPDTLQLTLSDVPLGVGTIYIQGDAVSNAGILFGDGVRCANGNLVRLGLKIDNGGPQEFGDDDISVDGMTTIGPATNDGQISGLGFVVGGLDYYYQAYYRNPFASWCPPETFNISNGLIVHW